MQVSGIPFLEKINPPVGIAHGIQLLAQVPGAITEADHALIRPPLRTEHFPRDLTRESLQKRLLPFRMRMESLRKQRQIAVSPVPFGNEKPKQLPPAPALQPTRLPAKSLDQLLRAPALAVDHRIA